MPIFQFYFLISMFLVSSGWLSIRFTSPKKEFKKNKVIYIILILWTLSEIVIIILNNRFLYLLYQISILAYMLYNLFICRLSLRLVHNNNKILFLYDKGYERCMKFKEQRFFSLVIFICFYIFIFTGVIIIQNTIGVNTYTETYKILFDDLMLLLLMVIYKPSNIILRDHVCPMNLFGKVSTLIL